MTPEKERLCISIAYVAPDYLLFATGFRAHLEQVRTLSIRNTLQRRVMWTSEAVKLWKSDL